MKLAILGFGIVGSGVAQLLEDHAAQIAAGAGEEVCLKTIVTRRDRPDSPFGDRIVHDFALVEQDPEISVVVETIGGCGAALDYTRRALQAGKHVVTSNKQLIAEHGRELLTLAREKGVNCLFEASVGGGIPLLRPLEQDLAANRICRICGIVNGTTNYILSAMRSRDLELEAALCEAQALGYAEADPSSDLSGMDAVRKACILADLSWRRELKPELVQVTGIEAVALEDIRNARTLGCAIKLLARLEHREDGRLYAWVAPHFVEQSSMLCHVDGAFNAVMVTGDALGDTLFYGTGAGSIPTASAVLADVADAVRHKTSPRGIVWSGESPLLGDPAELPDRWYVRSGTEWSLVGPCTAAELPADAVHYRVLK